MAKLPPNPVGVPPGSSYWNDWYEKLRTFVDQITSSVDWNIITNIPAWISASTGASNPSASVGLTPINGVSANFMRADAAPSLNQAIIPTWTGTHTFTSTITAQATVGLSQSTANSGAINAWNLVNSSNTANSSSSLFLSVGGASAGDPYIRYNISGVLNWAVGVDNSDGDSYVVSISSAPGTSNVIRAATTGAVSLPLGGLTVNSTSLLATSVALTNGAAASVGTLNNSPSGGNPSKWISINDNGTTRWIPTWS